MWPLVLRTGVRDFRSRLRVSYLGPVSVVLPPLPLLPPPPPPRTPVLPPPRRTCAVRIPTSYPSGLYSFLFRSWVCVVPLPDPVRLRPTQGRFLTLVDVFSTVPQVTGPSVLLEGGLFHVHPRPFSTRFSFNPLIRRPNSLDSTDSSVFYFL